MKSTFQLHWHDENCIVCEINQWDSWQQIDSSFEQYLSMLGTSKFPIHLIYVFQDIEVPQPWSITHIYKFMSMPKHPEQITFMVNTPRILKLVMGMAHQVYGLWQRQREFVYTDTLDAALAQLTPSEACNLHHNISASSQAISKAARK